MNDENLCECGHRETSHVDLMNSINQTAKKGKQTIVYKPCAIDGCECKEYKGEKIK